MDTTPTSPVTAAKLHPLLWVAGISVTLFALVGIASLTGWLPVRSTEPSPPAAAVAAPAVPAVPAPEPAAAPAAAPAALQPAPAVTAAPAPPPTRRKVAKAKPVADKPASPVAAVPPPYGTGVPPDFVPPAAVAPPVCANCGVVADIRQITHEGKGSGLGAIAGGVLGGAVANNFGGGNGRTLATIAGAVGGGLLGNKIEKDQKKTISYQLTVRMDDGTDQLLDLATEPAWRIGDAVRLVNGRLVAR